MISKKKLIRVSSLLFLVSMASGTVYSQQKENALTETKQVKAGMIKVSGKVIDSQTGGPMVGARVTYGKSVAKMTDAKGVFELEVLDQNSVITIAVDGYISKTVAAISGARMEIVLYPNAYSSFYKATNSIFGNNAILNSTSSGTKFDLNPWEQNSETLDSYLQGKIAGVHVVRRSGTPAIGANISVRGVNGLYTDNQPLYVIDGVVFDTKMHSSSITTGHVNNPLQSIDLRDIQDVALVKDAVMTSIYGARAANGVLVINTTHAKELATRIDFQANTGFNLSPKNLPLLNSYAYRSYLNDVLATSSLSGEEIAALPFNNDNRRFAEYAKYHNETDWQREIFKNTIDQNYFLRVTGGDEIAKYALSVGYNNESGVIDNTKQQKYTARFNGDMRLTNKLTAQTNISIGFGQQSLKDQGIATKTNPIFLSLIKAPFLHTNELANDGTVSPNYEAADYFEYSNPMQIIHNGVNSKKSYRFLGSLILDYKFNDRFKLSNLLAVTYDKAQESFFVPRVGVARDTVNNIEVYSRLGSQVARYYSISNDTRLAYNQSFGDDTDFQAIGGIRYQANDAEQDYVIGFNSATDHLVSIGNSTAVSRMYGGHIGKWANLTSYALTNLTLKNRYILNASVAVDGSSRFGDQVNSGLTLNGNTFGVFPAVGAGWIVSNEGFLRESDFINLFKVRASYGLVGNDDIGNFNARQNYISQNFLGVQGLVRDGVSNPSLKWEVIHKANLGLDVSLLNERLNVTVDVYQNTTKDMLVYNRGNSISGINYYLFNNGSMQNRGVDLNVFGRILGGKVKWDANLNLGTYKNEVTDIPEATYTEFAGATFVTQKGSVANAFYGYQFDGVFRTEAEAAAGNLGIRDIAGNKIPFHAGDARFVDRNGDGIIDDQDRTIIGNPNPDFFGGFANTVSYKKWRFNALFTFSVGNDVYNYTRSQLESGSSFYNQTELMLNRWRAEGQTTNVPRVTYGDPMGNARFSDRWIEDGSYLRLRQLSAEYRIDVNKLVLKYIRVYATANNLFTWSRYLGYDPEFGMSNNIFHQGVDATMEPLFKSYQLGVRFGL